MGDTGWRQTLALELSLPRQEEAHVIRAVSRHRLGGCAGKHTTARKLLASGTDPMAQRKAVKAAERIASENSFANVATGWLAHWRVGKSERHADYVERRLNTDILPRLGTLPIEDIKTPDVVCGWSRLSNNAALTTLQNALLRQPAKCFVTSSLTAWQAATLQQTSSHATF